MLDYGWVEDVCGLLIHCLIIIDLTRWQGVEKRYSELFITKIGSDLDGRTHIATISAPEYCLRFPEIFN
jgi:hypothetical protein